MRIQRYSVVLGLLAGVLWAAAPAWGVNRDLIQLQTQVQTLQDQMTHMQQSLDERMGVMRNLVEQDTDEPLATLTDSQVRPGREVLEQVMEELR